VVLEQQLEFAPQFGVRSLQVRDQGSDQFGFGELAGTGVANPAATGLACFLVAPRRRYVYSRM
jgi:hypothetical protein